MKINYLIIIFLALISSCSTSSNKEEKKTNATEIKIDEAKLFKIKELGDIRILTIFDKKGNQKEEYFLVPKEKQIPDTLKDKNIIKVPVQKVVCLSTTHLAFIDMLGESNSVKAVSGSQYIYNQNIRNGIKDGKIKDVGYENSLDFELLLSLKPDLVTVYDINGTISPTINKLKKFNIPVVQINEYLESSPLGQAEWIKFFAEFYSKRSFAESKFSEIYTSYNSLKKITDTIKERPTVLLNMPWKGTWYIPGGKSNVAQLVNDAGGNYLWKNNNETHNIPLNIEEVYLKANHADVWLNTGQAKSINDIINNDKRLSKFKAISTKNIFNRNKRLNNFGGNDYMESGTTRPDLILKDLIKILHPTVLKDDSLYYYLKME